jgi:hypothetical protein
LQFLQTANPGFFMRTFQPIQAPTPPVFKRLPTWEEHRRRQWLWIAILIALVVWGFTDVRRRARVEIEDPAAHKTDLTVYTEAGAAFFDGRDPYEATNLRGWHYLYPPLFALLIAPLSSLDTQTQALVWYFVSVAACYGLWCECRSLWRYVSVGNALRGVPEAPIDVARSTCPPERHRGRSLQSPNSNAQSVSPPAWLGWLAATAVALPTLNCLQRGQVGVVLVYLLLLGLRLVLTSASMRGVFLGGAVLALPVTIKLTPLLPVGFLALILLATAWRRRGSYATSLAEGLARGPLHRAFATLTGQIAGLIVFVFLLPGSLLGHRENLAHLATWVSRVVANDEVGIDNDFNARSKRNQSLTNAVRRLGNRLAFAAGMGPDDQLVDDLANQSVEMPMENGLMDHALRAAAAGLLVLLFVAGWRTARDGDSAGAAALFGLACTASLAVSPISWGHHYVMWLPGLVFVPFWLWQNGRRALAIGLAEVACVLVIAHYVVLDHSGRVGLLGIGATVWYVAATASIGWAPSSKPAMDSHDAAQTERSSRPQEQRRAA